MKKLFSKVSRWPRTLAFAFAAAAGKADIGHAFTLAPEKAVAYFRQKGMKLSFDWHEVYQEAHAQAFTVAKVTRMDLLQDIRNAVDKSLADGQTLAQFKRDIEPILKAKGWWGRQKIVNPDTGEVRETTLGTPTQLKKIYDTNLRTARAAGRFQEQLATADTAPYLQYVSMHDARTRASHLALDGKVFRIDDPFWATMYPPNDWGCRCRVRQLSTQDLADKNLTAESSSGALSKTTAVVSEATGEVAEVQTYTDPKTGVHTTTGAGWSYNPGLAAATDLSAYDKLKTWDKELQTQFWEEMQSEELTTRREARLSSFVDRVLLDQKVRGESVVVGWVADEDMAALAGRGVTLESPVLEINDRGILHQTRTEKASEQALTPTELKRLPSLLNKPEAVLWDEQDPALLYVVSSGEKKTKAVVKVNYKLKGQKERTNLIATTGKVSAYNLTEARYQKLRGKL